MNEAIDLSAVSGLPGSSLDVRNLTIDFGPQAAPPTDWAQRTARELAGVLQTPEASQSDDLLYRVWRGVVPRDAAEDVTRRRLRYVALLLRPGALTGSTELCRTRGHTNSVAPATRFPYPEVHEVWHGKALLYLQSNATAEPEDIVLIPLSPGDKAVVAPGWASLLVNIGPDPLIIGTWRMEECVTEHDSLDALHGMAHYVLQGAGGATPYSLEPNTAYSSVPVPRTLAPRELPDFGLKHGEPMLTTFRRNPDFLRFLLRPQDFDHVWSKLYTEEAGG